MQNLHPELSGMSANDPLASEKFAPYPGMAYELFLIQEDQKCGWGVFGGLDEQGNGQWYLNGFSDRSTLRLTPPVIDWKRHPLFHIPQQHRDNVRFSPVHEYERFLKAKLPKEIRDYFQRINPPLPDPILSCPHCLQTYTSKKHYATHVALCAEKKKVSAEKKAESPLPATILTCPHCPQTYTNQKYYVTHVALCAEKKKVSAEKKAKLPLPAPILKCPHCPKKYTDRKYYDTHVALCADKKKASNENIVETMKEKETLKCPHCKKAYTDPNYFERHVKGCPKKEAQPHICRTCGKTYVRAGDLQNHVAARVCNTGANIHGSDIWEGAIVRPPHGRKSQFDFAPFYLDFEDLEHVTLPQSLTEETEEEELNE